MFADEEDGCTADGIRRRHLILARTAITGASSMSMSAAGCILHLLGSLAGEAEFDPRFLFYYLKSDAFGSLGSETIRPTNASAQR